MYKNQNSSKESSPFWSTISGIMLPFSIMAFRFWTPYLQMFGFADEDNTNKPTWNIFDKLQLTYFIAMAVGVISVPAFKFIIIPLCISAVTFIVANPYILIPIAIIAFGFAFGGIAVLTPTFLELYTHLKNIESKEIESSEQTTNSFSIVSKQLSENEVKKPEAKTEDRSNQEVITNAFHEMRTTVSNACLFLFSFVRGQNRNLNSTYIEMEEKNPIQPALSKTP